MGRLEIAPFLRGAMAALTLVCGGLVAAADDPASPERNAPPLLFLHGFTCEPSTWDSQEKFFSDRYEVFAPILPCHAGSSLEATPTVEGLARSMLSYMEDDIGRPAVVIGHSLGGMVALHMALLDTEKVEAVVLVDAFPTLELARKNLKGLHGPDTPKEVETRATEMMAQGREAMNPEIHKRLWRSIVAMDVTNRLPEIRTSLLAVYGGRGLFAAGQEDQLSEKLQIDLAPNSKVSVLEGAGHFLSMEKSDDLNRCLEPFLASLSR